MANFDVGNLLTAQTILADRYKRPEMRMKPAPAFTLLTGNDNFLIVGAETLKTRDDRTIEAHLLNRTKRSSGSARAHDHTGTIDDSSKVTLTWTTKSDKTAISLKLLDKNMHDFNTVLANKLEQACMNILEDKETEAIAYLVAQKSTQSPTLKGATFNTVPDAVEVALADKSQFFQILKSVMRQNYFGGQLDIIADPIKMISAEFLNAQGSGNSTNYGFQFNNMNIAESVEYTDADYTSGSVIAMPAGTVAALNWIPKQNRQGWGDYNSYVGGYGTFQFMGFTFALHGYASRTNTSATNGDVQDVTMEFELSLDSSFNKAPLVYTTSRTDSVIIQFGQLAA
jgi:hypothetical protein